MAHDLPPNVAERLALIRSAPPIDRARLLADSFPDDPVRQRLLLDALGPALTDAATIIPCVAPTPLDPVGASPSVPGLPPRIGPYRILEILGEGGMGVVYLAEQDRPRRQVALKVVRSGLLSRALLRRFEVEAQVLGRLQHPGIAQVYDAGLALIPSPGEAEPSPVPYFAMELLHGPTLDAYAREHALGPRERLALMAKVCDAVHHAHTRGVVHRDLKPSNILVVDHPRSGRVAPQDRVGQPKVLDFGVARAADSDLRATMQTDVGQLVGTIPYMSPEQIAGQVHDLDVRSDVYTLGVILYELLTGSLPYVLSDKTIPEAARIIAEESPRPLTRLDRTLAGDPATIVGKALEKPRERRYQSAAELAEDLRRYLRSEPIRARPPSTWYLLRRFAQRNTALVGGTAAVMLVLVSGVAATGWQAVRAQEGRRDAEAATLRAAQERDVALTINGFLETMLKSVRPEEAMGREPTMREVLDAASRTAATDLRDKPIIQAEVRSTLGETYRSLGLFEPAQEHFEAARDLFGRHEGPEAARTINATRNLAMVQAQRGAFLEARAALDWALARESERHGPGSVQAAVVRMELAGVLHQQGQQTQAEAMLREVLAVLRAVPTNSEGGSAAEASAGNSRDSLITALNNLGSVIQDQGRLEEAEAFHREALQMRLALKGPDHPDTLYSMNNLGATLASMNRREEALELFERTIEARRRVLGPEHPATMTTQGNINTVLVQLGRQSEAEPGCKRVYEFSARVLGPDHPRTLMAANVYAYVLEDLGKFDQAEPLYREAVEIRTRTKGTADPETWAPMNNLAMLLQRQGRLAEARALYEEVLALVRGNVPDDHPYVGIFRNNLGECLTLMGEFDRAAEELEASHAILVARLGPESPRVAKSTQRREELERRRNMHATRPGNP